MGWGAALWGSCHTLWSGGHCAGTGQASSIPKGATMGSHHSRGIYQCFPWAGNLLCPCKSHRWWTNRHCISPVVGWWRLKAEGGGGGGMFQVTQLAPPVLLGTEAWRGRDRPRVRSICLRLAALPAAPAPTFTRVAQDDGFRAAFRLPTQPAETAPCRLLSVAGI